MSWKTNKNKKKQSRKLNYKGIELDSQGELWFVYWMEELQNRGYINKFTRGDSYLLSNELNNHFVKKMKTKSKPCSEVIMKGHSYSVDFEIQWNKKAENIFYNMQGTKWDKYFFCLQPFNKSQIECKPDFDFNNMTRLATNNIKHLYDKLGIFCQMVKYNDLFRNTFVPKKVLTLKNGTNRKFAFKVKTLDQFLNEKQ